jgi:hypothetical protein
MPKQRVQLDSLKPFHDLLWVDAKNRARTVFIVFNQPDVNPWRLYEDHPSSGPVCIQAYKKLPTACLAAVIEAHLVP